MTVKHLSKQMHQMMLKILMNVKLIELNGKHQEVSLMWAGPGWIKCVYQNLSYTGCASIATLQERTPKLGLIASGNRSPWLSREAQLWFIKSVRLTNCLGTRFILADHWGSLTLLNPYLKGQENVFCIKKCILMKHPGHTCLLNRVKNIVIGWVFLNARLVTNK